MIDRKRFRDECDRIAKKPPRDVDGRDAAIIRDALDESPRASIEKVLADVWDGNFDAMYAAAHALKFAKPKKATSNSLTIPLQKLRIVVGDLHVRRDFCNGGAVIVTGDVTVDGLYWDRDVGCMLVALGDVFLARANIYGGTRIGGKLESRVLFGIDHSDSIFVGSLKGSLVMLADKSIYATKSDVEILVGEADRISGKKKIGVASFDPAVLAKHLVSEVIDDSDDPDWEVPIDVNEAFKRDAKRLPLFKTK